MAPPSRAPALLALGVRLAGRGVVAYTAYAVAAVTVLGAVALALVLARRGSDALADVPGVAARALAWGAGVTLAFGAATRAFRKDRDDGVRALLAARGASAPRYVAARVVGVSALLALVVVGGTFVVAGVTLGLAGGGRLGVTAWAAVGALAYALAFAATFAPLSVAALGARSRVGGYGVLVAILVVPELLTRWTDELLPRAWSGLESLPAMLASVGDALGSPVDAPRLARALVALAIVAIVATAAVGVEVARVDRGEPS